MNHPSHGRLVAHRLGRWSAQVAEGESAQQTTAGLASSPLATFERSHPFPLVLIAVGDGRGDLDVLGGR